MSNFQLPTNFAIGNAAGPVKNLADVVALSRTGLDIITLGSITVLRRDGNGPGIVHYYTPEGATINALGMPNLGVEEYKKLLKQMVDVAHTANKKFAVSIAIIDPGDLEILLDVCIVAGVDIIELNAGCPNVYSDGKQKRILSFDLKGLSMCLQEMISTKSLAKWPGELRVKVSPYSDPVLLQEAAQMIGSLGHRSYRITVVTSNTFPNGRMYVWENGVLRPAITYSEGLGGVSGEGFRSIALGQVYQFRKHLPDDHPIVGVGGIHEGRHCLEFTDNGANQVQVGAYIYNATDATRAAQKLLDELGECIA